jgi:hypothetical protein
VRARQQGARTGCEAPTPAPHPSALCPNTLGQGNGKNPVTHTRTHMGKHGGHARHPHLHTRVHLLSRPPCFMQWGRVKSLCASHLGLLEFELVDGANHAGRRKLLVLHKAVGGTWEDRVPQLGTVCGWWSRGVGARGCGG